MDVNIIAQVIASIFVIVILIKRTFNESQMSKKLSEIIQILKTFKEK